MASSIEDFNVIRDDGQPLQFPSSRNLIPPSGVTPIISTLASMQPEARFDLFQRATHARLQIERMQAVQDQQIGN